MSTPERIVTPAETNEDQTEKSLRPQTFEAFIGQEKVCKNLHIFIEAARKRGDALDHVLFSGAPGLGKTTLAYLIAQTLGSNLQVTSGPALPRAGELAALLTNLQPRDVLFIDEIHRLPIAVEEILYQALEDYKIDMTVGEGPHARPLRLNLAPFTLVGATTRSGLLSRPLRDRFGIAEHFSFYTPEELTLIIIHAARKLNTTIAPEAAKNLATRARGTPRIALRLLRRLVDFACVAEQTSISLDLLSPSLKALDIDSQGLDSLDRRYLEHLAYHFKGGPVGIETLSAALFEEKRTLEDVVEPYLMQQGFLQRTAQGRVLGERAYEHLNITPPKET
jgi:Holliday junction DNA helicase RuvB